MAKILWINACVRGEKSRTLKLANAFRAVYCAKNPQDTITELDLMQLRLQPQYPEILAARDALWEAGKLSDPMFDLAHQFASADKIIIAAPFWELSFPAILKIYLERITVTDITFGYDDAGMLKGLCNAQKLLLVTTRGGNFSAPKTEWLEMGFRQLKALCAMYGIAQAELLCAENLDNIHSDAAALLAEAVERAKEMAETF